MSKISELPAVTPAAIDGSEFLPVVKGQATYRASLAAIAEGIGDLVGPFGAIKLQHSALLNEMDRVLDQDRSLFVQTSAFTKSHKSGANTETIAILSRDSDTQFTVAAGKGAILAADGAVAIHDAVADRYTSHGIISIVGDVVTIAGTLPATCSTCEPMPDAVTGQHLSRHGYRGLADFIASRSTRYAFRKPTTLFAYHPPITKGISWNNPDIYALDGVTKLIDVDTLGGAAGGGFVGGTADLPRLCQANSADVNITNQTLTNYLPRAYVVQDSGAGKGIQFSFAGGAVDGFMEIPIAAARVPHSGGNITTGRVRLEVIGDGVSIFDQTFAAGQQQFARVDFGPTDSFTIRMTLADSVPTKAMLGGLYAWQKSPDTPTGGFFRSGDVVGFLGDSWTQFPNALAGENKPLRPDGSEADGMQFLSERLRTRLAADGIAITTRNYGKGGTTSAWGLYWVRSMIAAEPSMTHCIINFWINDHNSVASAGGNADTAWDFDPANKWAFKVQSAGGLKGAVTYGQWFSNLRQICDILLQEGIRPIVLMPAHTGSAAQTQSIQQQQLTRIAAGFVAPT